jgi:hypothetical protein
MFFESAFIELISFIKSFVRTHYIVLFSPGYLLTDLTTPGVPSRRMNPLVFLAISMSLFLMYMGAISSYNFDFKRAMDSFRNGITTNSELSTFLLCIPVLGIGYAYITLCLKLLIKNKNERAILRDYFYYLAASQLIIFTLLHACFLYSWHLLMLPFDIVSLVRAAAYTASYALPSMSAFYFLSKRYRGFKLRYLIAALLAVIVIFAIDVTYFSSRAVNYLLDPDLKDVVIKGTTADNLIVPIRMADKAPSTVDSPPQDFKFDIYVCNNTHKAIMIDDDDTMRVRYFLPREYKNFRLDTGQCKPTEMSRPNEQWYKLAIIGHDDTTSMIKILPGDIKRMTLQLVKSSEFLPFRLENCYPYKMFELSYVTADYRYFNRMFEWKPDTVRQIVAFKNRLNDEQ